MIFEDTSLDEGSVENLAQMVQANANVSLLGFLHCQDGGPRAQPRFASLRPIVLALAANSNLTELIVDVHSGHRPTSPITAWDDAMTRALALSSVASLTLRLPVGWTDISINAFLSGIHIKFYTTMEENFRN